MAGLDDLRAESNERWAKAARYAQGFADNGMGEALRVYYTRYFPAGVIVYAASLALIGPLFSGNEPTDWLFLAQLGISAFGLLAAITGLIYNAKQLKPRVELGKNLSITLPLDKDEQKYVRRVVNGKELAPQDPGRLSVARSFAVQTRKNLATNLLVVPVYSYCLAYVIEDLSIVWTVLFAVFVVTTSLLIREFRRAGRFLTATTPQSPS